MDEDLLKLKAERDDYKSRFEELKIKAELAGIIETLPSRYDKTKVKGMTDDSIEVFILDKNERVVTRSGKPAKNWILERANLYGFTRNTPAKQQGENQDYRFTGGVNLVDPEIMGKLT